MLLGLTLVLLGLTLVLLGLTPVLLGLTPVLLGLTPVLLGLTPVLLGLMLVLLGLTSTRRRARPRRDLPAHPLTASARWLPLRAVPARLARLVPARRPRR